MAASSTDLYAILGLARDAGADDIKKAYRKLARQYHPDVSNEPEAEQRFKEINLAYEVLSDPQRRQQYDSFGTTSERGGVDSGFGGAGFGSINDIFEFFFGGGGMGGFSGFSGMGGARRRGQSPGEDIRRAVHLKLKEVLNDKPVSFTLERREPCHACSGSGAEPGSEAGPCQTCGGHGQVMSVRDTLLGRMQTVTTCPACHGEGVVVNTPCKSCKGTGHEYRQRSIEATIPKGVEDGNILRIGGQGHSGRHGGPAGDLLVELGVEPDKRFERRGADLLTSLEVSFPDLALGATLSVPTLEGSESLRIPAGTPSHHEFILRGQGLPRLRGGGRGNLHVLVEVEVPARLSKRERELLEELRGKSGAAEAPVGEESGVETTGPKPGPKRGLFGKRRGAEG